MSTEVAEWERRIADLGKGYDDATRTLVTLSTTRSRKEDRLTAFHAWREAGTAFFNANEQLVAVASRTGTDRDATWFNHLGESAAGLLEVVCRHYGTMRQHATDLKLSIDSMLPSRTAFAGLQRLAARINPQLGRQLRDEFVRAGLPTHGFDSAESVKPGSAEPVAPWEKICGSLAAAVFVAVVAIVVLRNEPFSDPNQVVLVRMAASFSIALFGACIPGFLHLRLGKGKNFVRAGGALALFAVTYFFTPTVLPPNPPLPTTSSRAAEDIDVVDVGFAAHPGEAQAPRLDIKLSNRGSAPAFVKGVKLSVKKAWRVPNFTATGVVVPPSHEYVVRLPPSPAPFEVNLPVSHGLKPDEMDRFTVQLQEVDWGASHTIYWADVEIVANGSSLTYRKDNLLFLVTQAGTTFPRRADIPGMLSVQRAMGKKVDAAELERTLSSAKAMIVEASRVQGVRSYSLQRLIEEAMRSDLG